MKCSQWNVNQALTWTRCPVCDSPLMWCMLQGKGPCRYSSSMQLSFPGCPPCCDVMLKLCLCLERGGEGPPFVFAHLCARLCRGACAAVVCGWGPAHRRADSQTGKWEDGRVWFVLPRFFQRRFDWVHLCAEELERWPLAQQMYQLWFERSRMFLQHRYIKMSEKTKFTNMS